MDLVPLQHFDHRWNGNGHRHQLERQRLGALHRQTRCDGGDAAGADDELRRETERRHPDLDATIEIGPTQELLIVIPGLFGTCHADDDVPEVEITIDMDGYGPPGSKIEGYYLYAASDYAEHAAFKLFYKWDVPMLTPERVLSLSPAPDYVIYQ